jgi:hypothetical protein
MTVQSQVPGILVPCFYSNLKWKSIDLAAPVLNTDSLIWSAEHAQRRIDITIKGTRLNKMIPILKMLMPAQ